MTDQPWRTTLADVVLDERERSAVDEVLRSGWLSMGPVTERFELDFQRFVGAGHAVAVANGTAALHLAAAALEIGPGDEVICPTLTFVARSTAWSRRGRRPSSSSTTAASPPTWKLSAPPPSATACWSWRTQRTRSARTSMGALAARWATPAASASSRTRT
jgi:hypothetical protein